MSLDPAQIIDLTVEPAQAVINRERLALQRSLTRREFARLLGSGVAALVVGLTTLFSRSERALATSESGNAQSGCAGISGGDYDDTSASHGCCICGSDISSYYCHTGGWHRHDTVSGSGYSTTHYLRPTSCNGKNNWTWNKSGTTWRCADGWYRVTTQFGFSDHDSVCPSTV